MKYIFSWIAILGFLLMLVPMGLNVIFTEHGKDESSDDIMEKTQVYVTSQNKVVTMEREDYILGVLMAEMPAEFEPEALKAQAVAARTYLAEKIKASSNLPEHRGGIICTDSTHCQAYISTEDAMNKWGKNASLYFEKCKNAVNDTRGIIVVYKGEPIKAVFHAFASGRTENAGDVWGSDVAYLKSVESPGDKTAPRFESAVEISIDDFKSILSKECGQEMDNIAIGEVKRSSGGYVSEVQIGDKSFKGTKLRTLFGLRSACFDIVPTENSIVFNVRGYGHGVGMSQYGANYFAKDGMTYDKILTTYYSGIDFAYLE